MEEEEEEVTEVAAAARGRVARACSLQAARAIARLQHRSSSRCNRSVPRSSMLSSVLTMETKTPKRRKKKKKTTTTPGGVDEEWPWMNDSGIHLESFIDFQPLIGLHLPMCNSICCVQLTHHLSLYTMEDVVVRLVAPPFLLKNIKKIQ